MSQEEARRRVEMIEAKHATELERLEERNRELRAKLLESTHENTRRLREVADLSSRQFTLEKACASSLFGRLEFMRPARSGNAFRCA